MFNHLRTKKFLTSVFGKNRVYHKPVDCFGYAYDASPESLNHKWTPAFVVKAHTTEEVSQLLRYCHKKHIPVTTRGLGSGRSGGSIPVCGGIVLSLDEMDQLIELDQANMMVTCQAGMRTKTLYDLCAKEGLFYPPDPSSHLYSTIGGNIAENAGGMRAVKYGVTAQYVMALEVVLADGEIINVGGKMVKNVTGYNLLQLFVGSEGTLGVITKATLRLLALPKAIGSAQATFSSLQDACLAVSAALKSGITPAAAELMDATSIQAAERFLNFIAPQGTTALIMFDCDGSSEKAVLDELKVLESICQKHGATGFIPTIDENKREELWQVRRKLSGAVAAMAPDKIGEDISVPRAKLAEVVAKLDAISKKHQIKLAIYGHAGDGNLHPAFLCDTSKASDREKLALAIDETFQAALDCDGTLSGEHGIGISKQAYIANALSQTVIETSLAVKKALDPRHILNPNKIFDGGGSYAKKS